MRSAFLACDSTNDRDAISDVVLSMLSAASIREAEGAVAAEPTGWQPIETAPKQERYLDGRNSYSEYMLGWYPGAIAPFRMRWWQLDSGPHNFLADGGYAVFPTHWQPLPPAPKE